MPVAALRVDWESGRKLQTQRIRFQFHSVEIFVDDGVKTPLDYKGDGVQSLAALGIIRHASEGSGRGKMTRTRAVRWIVYFLWRKRHLCVTDVCVAPVLAFIRLLLVRS